MYEVRGPIPGLDGGAILPKEVAELHRTMLAGKYKSHMYQGYIKFDA